MNVPINPSLAGLTSALAASSTGGISGVNGQAQAHQGGKAVLADQDWFSAQSLSDGQTIEASRFDSNAGDMSVEQAAENIYARLFSGL